MTLQLIFVGLGCLLLGAVGFFAVISLINHFMPKYKAGDILVFRKTSQDSFDGPDFTIYVSVERVGKRRYLLQFCDERGRGTGQFFIRSFFIVNVVYDFAGKKRKIANLKVVK